MSVKWKWRSWWLWRHLQEVYAIFLLLHFTYYFKSNNFTTSHMSIFISCYPQSLNFQCSKLESLGNQKTLLITDDWLDSLWQPCRYSASKFWGNKAKEVRVWHRLDPRHEPSLRYVSGVLLCGSGVKVLKQEHQKHSTKYSSEQLDAHLEESTTNGWQVETYSLMNVDGIFCFRCTLWMQTKSNMFWQLLPVIKLQYYSHEYGCYWRYCLKT